MVKYQQFHMIQPKSSREWQLPTASVHMGCNVHAVSEVVQYGSSTRHMTLPCPHCTLCPPLKCILPFGMK